MTLSELKRLRLARRWTQAQLAGKVGVHVQTVNRWERGHLAITTPMGQLLRIILTAESPASMAKAG